MGKRENSFIKGLQPYLLELKVYAEKNNNPYRGGTFDVFYSGSKNPLWVEYKFIDVPVRDSTIIVPELSTLQLNWGASRLLEGREAWVVVGCKAGAVRFHPDEWERGISTGAFRARTVKRAVHVQQIHAFTGSSPVI